MIVQQLDPETRREMNRRLEENGWRWRDREAEEQWGRRIVNRVAHALLDPDRNAGSSAAKAAFVDGLEDAGKAGALVASTSWRRVRALRDAMG